jgi:hypothetical protein
MRVSGGILITQDFLNPEALTALGAEVDLEDSPQQAQEEGGTHATKTKETKAHAPHGPADFTSHGQ